MLILSMVYRFLKFSRSFGWVRPSFGRSKLSQLVIGQSENAFAILGPFSPAFAKGEID